MFFEGNFRVDLYETKWLRKIILVNVLNYSEWVLLMCMCTCISVCVLATQ